MTDLVEVHLLQLPVRIWMQAQEQTDALRREFALMDSQPEESGHEVPRRLTTLMAELDERYGGVSSEQELELFAAADGGKLVIDDLVYLLPAEAAGASAELGAMLDESDAYCAQGQHLLTLAAGPEVVRFRRWFLAQFVDQAAGRPPVAWTDWP